MIMASLRPATCRGERINVGRWQQVAGLEEFGAHEEGPNSEQLHWARSGDGSPARLCPHAGIIHAKSCPPVAGGPAASVADSWLLLAGSRRKFGGDNKQVAIVWRCVESPRRWPLAAGLPHLGGDKWPSSSLRD